LIDPILPGMNGNELLRRIRNIYPGLPIIIMSGYSSIKVSQFDSVAAQNEPNKSTLDILKKPFTTEEIKSVIIKTLENYSNSN
jgi:DNA-binding NtrC family response regulator